MDDRRRWPAGISPRGRGLRVRIYKHGRTVYQETIRGNPYDPVTEAAAVARREDLLARQRLGLPLRQSDPGPPIFADVAERWLASLQIGTRQIAKYYTMLNTYWMPCYASWPVNEITQADIQERLAGFEVAIKTQKNLVTPLRGVLKHAGVNPNPADALNWPSKARTSRKNKRRDRYSIDERARLLARLDALAVKHRALAEEKPTQGNRTAAHWAAQAALYFRIFFGIGTRPGETLALTQTVYDGEFLWIEAQYTRGEFTDTTKTGSDRRVYVPQQLRPYLDNHASRFTGGPILTSYRGGPLKDTKRLNPWWAEAHRLERIRYREPYVCRHTRAAELLSQGVDPAAGAYQLGHSLPMFTELYGEFIEEYHGRADWSRFETATVQSPTSHVPLNSTENKISS